jgi:TolB protein
MTERWERMVRSLRDLEAPIEVMTERIEQGPRTLEPPPLRQRVAAALVALALSAGTTVLVWRAVGPGGDAPAASSGGKIAFELWRPTQSDTRHLIYIVGPDGEASLDLTPDGALYASPSWSPDGDSLAVVRTDPGGEVGVYFIRADGSGLRELLDVGAEVAVSVQQVTWSPNGQQLGLVYADRNGARASRWVQRLYVAKAGGGAVQPLTDDGMRVSSFSWSPDGSSLVFAAAPRGRGSADPELFIISAAGGPPTPLGTRGSTPAWSPDGTKIAFAGHAPGAGDSDIFVMAIEDHRATRLTTGPQADFWPVWSADGETIVFQRQLSGVDESSCSLTMMDASGTNQRTLVDGSSLGGCPSRPSWQPPPG